MKKAQTFTLWTARIIAAIILLQTLFFKFTAADESVYIFLTVGMEPWGRIGAGVMELIASMLILIPAVSWLGSVIAMGLMLGAIGMHLTLLGIEVQGDGGYLFYLALMVTLCATYVLWHDREKLKCGFSKFGF